MIWPWQLGKKFKNLEKELKELKEKFHTYTISLKLTCPYCHLLNHAAIDEKTQEIVIICANCKRKTVLWEERKKEKKHEQQISQHPNRI